MNLPRVVPQSPPGPVLILGSASSQQEFSIFIPAILTSGRLEIEEIKDKLSLDGATFPCATSSFDPQICYIRIVSSADLYNFELNKENLDHLIPLIKERGR